MSVTPEMLRSVHQHSEDKQVIPLLTVLHTLFIQRSFTYMTSHELKDNVVGPGHVVPVWGNKEFEMQRS